MKKLRNQGWISFIFLASFAVQTPAHAAWTSQSCGIEKNSKRSLMSTLPSVAAYDDEIDAESVDPMSAYIQKLALRMNGIPMSFNSPRFNRALKLAKMGDFIGASQTLAQDENFLNVRVKTFAAPFSSKDASPAEPLNDLQALIIGVVRDELDARLILTGNIRYQGYKSLGLPAITAANNDHYLQFESKTYSFATDLEFVNKQWDTPLGVAAGAFTTRAWAAINYDAGTNRRSLKNAFETFLCSPIDSWKVRGVPDFFVRRDVDRAPGGNPATFLNTCRNCHGIMDGMAGAFARFDFTAGAISYLSAGVAPKMNQNANVYPAGYVTVDDSWTNLTKYNSSIDFGWRTKMTGQGVAELGQMLAQSGAYSRCLVSKAFQEVCGGAIQDIAPEMLAPLTSDFEARNYNLKYLLTKIGSLTQCLAHPSAEAQSELNIQEYLND